MRQKFYLWRLDRYIKRCEAETLGGMIPDEQVTIFGYSSQRVYTLAELKRWRSTLSA